MNSKYYIGAEFNVSDVIARHPHHKNEVLAHKYGVTYQQYVSSISHLRRNGIYVAPKETERSQGQVTFIKSNETPLNKNILLRAILPPSTLAPLIR